MAFKIILHTFRMIFGNFGQALRVSIGPYAFLMAFIAVGGFLTGGTLSVAGGEFTGPTAGPFTIFILMAIAFFVFVIGWVAVSWHRFILLEERAGLLPAIEGRPIGSYLGKLFLLTLLVGVIALPIFSFLLDAMASDFQRALGVHRFPTADNFEDLQAFQMRWRVINAVVSIPFLYLGLRWGIALVGTAVGKPMGFFAAWSAAKPIGITLFGIVVLLIVINFVLQLIPLFLLKIPLLQGVADISVTWVSMMLGVSILTTLYGHVIEGRPLVSG